MSKTAVGFARAPPISALVEAVDPSTSFALCVFGSTGSTVQHRTRMSFPPAGSFLPLLQTHADHTSVPAGAPAHGVISADGIRPHVDVYQR